MKTIAEQLHFLKENEYVEVRILNTNKGTLSGYFNNYEFLEKQLSNYNGRYNIFFTMNSINPDIACRSLNHFTPYSKNTTTDSEITYRNYILVDVDPKRPSGISSTDSEKQFALDKAEIIKEDLKEYDIQSISADSGNGAHLLIPVFLENTEENTKFVKDFLTVIHKKYSDENVDIDLTVSNPARIIKLYGTTAVKGDYTNERPHRQSMILEDIDNFDITTTDRKYIEKYIQDNDVSDDPLKSSSKEPKVSQSKNFEFNLLSWLDSHEIHVTKKKEIDNGTLYEISPCPWNNGHDKDNGAFIIQNDDGRIVAKCHHEKCIHENWDTLWKKYEGDVPNPNENVNKKKSINKTSIADIVLDMIINLEKHTAFKNQYNEVFVRVKKNNKVFNIDDFEYYSYVSTLYFKYYQKTVKDEHIKLAIRTFKAIALSEGKKCNTYLRMAFENDNLYYYLGNEEEDVIKLEKQSDGSYEYSVSQLTDDECVFIPSPLLKPQCIPVQNTEGKNFLDFMNSHYSILSDEELLLHNVLLVYHFIYDLEKPIAVFSGSRGSGKSTLTKQDIMLLNNCSNLLNSKPKTEKDMCVLLNNNDIVAIDNVTKLNKSESDLLCMAISTDSVSTVRRLYTNNEIVTYSLYTGIYLTCCDGIISYATDFLDRCIFFHTIRLDEKNRKEETEILQNFKDDMPFILYEIFANILPKALEKVKYEQVKEYHVRVTSFEKFGRLIAKEIGYSEEAFINALVNNRKKIDNDLIENDDFASLINQFILERKSFKGSPTELYNELKIFSSDKGFSITKYVASPSSLSRKINDKKEAFSSNGIEINSKQSNGRRYINLQLTDINDDFKSTHLKENSQTPARTVTKRTVYSQKKADEISTARKEINTGKKELNEILSALANQEEEKVIF